MPIPIVLVADNLLEGSRREATFWSNVRRKLRDCADVRMIQPTATMPCDVNIPSLKIAILAVPSEHLFSLDRNDLLADDWLRRSACCLEHKSSVLIIVTPGETRDDLQTFRDRHHELTAQALLITRGLSGTAVACQTSEEAAQCVKAALTGDDGLSQSAIELADWRTPGTLMHPPERIREMAATSELDADEQAMDEVYTAQNILRTR
ncbi:hypothetical protein PYCC9005_003016 [Savitreella phatthalungensis]